MNGWLWLGAAVVVVVAQVVACELRINRRSALVSTGDPLGNPLYGQARHAALTDDPALVQRCGPECSEMHTYTAGCLLRPLPITSEVADDHPRWDRMTREQLVVDRPDPTRVVDERAELGEVDTTDPSYIRRRRRWPFH